MGKKVYIGVNNVPKNVTKIYVGVNGVARKVVKGYVGVNGVARVFWDGGGSAVKVFWFFYSTIAGKIIDGKRYTVVPTQIPVEVQKKNTGIAFYFFIQQIEAGSIIENLVFTVSTDSTATPFNGIWGGQTYPFDSVDSTTVNNDIWYYTIGAPFDYDYAPQYPADISPNCIVRDADLEELYDVEDMVKGFLNRYIYTDDFAYNYQVGQTYNLVLANKEKTIRKALAVALFKQAKNKDNVRIRDGYAYIINHFESLVTELLNRLSNCNAFEISVDFQSGYESRLILVRAGNVTNVTASHTIRITAKSNTGGYDYFNFENSVSPTKLFRAELSVSGTLSWINMTVSGSLYMIGMYPDYGVTSNIGLKFPGDIYIAPEYNYQTGQTYTLHSAFELGKEIDYCSTKALTFVSSYNILDYFKANYATIVAQIKSKLNDYLEEHDLTPKVYFCSWSITSGRMSFNCYWNTSATLPVTATISNQYTDDKGNVYYVYNPNIRAEYYLYAYVTTSGVTVNDPYPVSGGSSPTLSLIGEIWRNQPNVSVYNMGMKEV